jgi:hypothetical protein
VHRKVAHLECKLRSAWVIAGTRRSLRSTTANSGCTEKYSGERGPGEPEGLRANRGVYRVADGEAELTEATDATGAQRRP